MMDVGKQAEEQHIQHNYRLFVWAIFATRRNELMRRNDTYENDGKRLHRTSFSVSLIPVRPPHNHITDLQCISLWYLCVNPMNKVNKLVIKHIASDNSQVGCLANDAFIRFREK